jgi:hypothetical protein
VSSLTWTIGIIRVPLPAASKTTANKKPAEAGHFSSIPFQHPVGSRPGYGDHP